ncbi:arsenate reductase ArsC [Paenibacillus qinlingensis]|uniref:Arsenate reductase n=1 Tax=Paenibacillus qinlingensis TaxID=1837343 RepID=A0ABU1P2N8_9BACL|nr:arsenate reductase ArsC [Paenibacillus qinlingensis]MDR6553988.1 arsenate reductase [Paenibacillus qinlingensis]
MMSKKPVRIYFLCIQNRCRSQIAEAFAKHYGKDNVIAESAGLEASDIHPLTVEVMKEVGIDISNQTSKKIDMKTFLASNVIVKLCENLVERCPVVPFGITNVQWNILDPLEHSEGNLEALRKNRDEIEKKVIELLKGMNVPV